MVFFFFFFLISLSDGPVVACGETSEFLLRGQVSRVQAECLDSVPRVLLVASVTGCVHPQYSVSSFSHFTVLTCWPWPGPQGHTEQTPGLASRLGGQLWPPPSGDRGRRRFLSVLRALRPFSVKGGGVSARAFSG